MRVGFDSSLAIECAVAAVREVLHGDPQQRLPRLRGRAVHTIAACDDRAAPCRRDRAPPPAARGGRSGDGHRHTTLHIRIPPSAWPLWRPLGRRGVATPLSPRLVKPVRRSVAGRGVQPANGLLWLRRPFHLRRGRLGGRSLLLMRLLLLLRHALRSEHLKRRVTSGRVAMDRPAVPKDQVASARADEKGAVGEDRVGDRHRKEVAAAVIMQMGIPPAQIVVLQVRAGHDDEAARVIRRVG